MKRIILFTVTASAALATYFALRNCACNNKNEHAFNEVKRDRHLTNAFSKAKQQIFSEE